MVRAGAGHRPGPWALLPLAVVLAVLGVHSGVHFGALAVESQTATGELPRDDVAVGVADVRAVSPSTASGRLAAAPSLLRTHGHAETLPTGTAPSGALRQALARLDVWHGDLVPVLRATRPSTAGDRAPPSRQQDL